jgi:uncharacterized protein YjaG (DUF416 family)
MASALSGESVERGPSNVEDVPPETVTQLAKALSIPQGARDQARNMLDHGRSLEEVVAVTKLSMYTVRRLRQQVMAARIMQRNRKAEGAAQRDFSNSEKVIRAQPTTTQIVT